MKHQFVKRTDIIYDEDGVPFTVYGFNAVSEDGEVLLELPDVAFEPQFVDDLINKFIENETPLCCIEEDTIQAIEEQYVCISGKELSYE